VGGEAPDAVDEDADGQPDHGLVADAGDGAVAQRDRLGDDALDADVGVLGAAGPGPVERGVGEGGERQRAELRVDAVEHGPNLRRGRGSRPPGGHASCRFRRGETDVSGDQFPETSVSPLLG